MTIKRIEVTAASDDVLVWLHSLPEIGDLYRKRARKITQDEEDAKKEYERAKSNYKAQLAFTKKERKKLEKELAKDWTPEEIAEAKRTS